MRFLKPFTVMSKKYHRYCHNPFSFHVFDMNAVTSKVLLVTRSSRTEDNSILPGA